MEDQVLYCRDCGREFYFTVGEREFYVSKNLACPPGRCPDCRASRRSGVPVQDASSPGSAIRTLYSAVCASCGRMAQVPFQPWPGRPVYCKHCFQPRAR